MNLEAEKPQGETGRLIIEQISPFTFLQFIQNQEGDLKIPKTKRADYRHIFDALRTLPFVRQEELFVDFFTQKVEGFPNGEKAGAFLAEVNNINWFSPTKTVDKKLLQEHVDTHLQALNLCSSLPVRLIKNDWGSAWKMEREHKQGIWRLSSEAARTAGWDATWVAKWQIAKSKVINISQLTQARDEEIHAIRIMVGKVIKRAAFAAPAFKDMVRIFIKRSDEADKVPWVVEQALENVWHDTVDAAQWIVVEDLMPKAGYTKGNPFLPLIEIYKLGYWPIGPVEDEFVIFSPPIKRSLITSEIEEEKDPKIENEEIEKIKKYIGEEVVVEIEEVGYEFSEGRSPEDKKWNAGALCRGFFGFLEEAGNNSIIVDQEIVPYVWGEHRYPGSSFLGGGGGESYHVNLITKIEFDGEIIYQKSPEDFMPDDLKEKLKTYENVDLPPPMDDD